MQQQRYENLKVAIEEVRQARHDIRHHLNQISMLAEADDMGAIKVYLAQTVSRIPDLDMHFCEKPRGGQRARLLLRALRSEREFRFPRRLICRRSSRSMKSTWAWCCCRVDPDLGWCCLGLGAAAGLAGLVAGVALRLGI